MRTVDLNHLEFLESSGVRKRSFKKGVSGGTCLVFTSTFLFASGTEKEHPMERRHGTPFPDTLSVQKRSAPSPELW